MKKIVLLLLLFCSAVGNAQSLKDALYGGKLKNDAGTVIRKSDDLSTKIDSTRKVAPADSLVKKSSGLPGSPALAANDSAANATGALAGTGVATTAAEGAQTATAATEADAAPKDNTAVLKSFMDTLIGTLKTDVLPSKRVKDGSYLVLISYAIETDGQLSFSDIFVAPESKFLQEQISQRLAIDVPKLQPEHTSTGKPRKVNKKYKFTLVKE